MSFEKSSTSKENKKQLSYSICCYCCHAFCLRARSFYIMRSLVSRTFRSTDILVLYMCQMRYIFQGYLKHIVILFPVPKHQICLGAIEYLITTRRCFIVSEDICVQTNCRRFFLTVAVVILLRRATRHFIEIYSRIYFAINYFLLDSYLRCSKLSFRFLCQVKISFFPGFFSIVSI